jgi:hypothetical protein
MGKQVDSLKALFSLVSAATALAIALTVVSPRETERSMKVEQSLAKSV